MYDRMQCALAELKFAEGADAMTFSGYGAVFGNVDSYGDVIAKGAFADTIREAKATGQWPAMLLQHGGMGLTADDMTPIGVWTSMAEDEKGLLLEGKLAPTPRGQEMYALMKMLPRPAINGLSIGYRPIEWQMRSSPDEPRRTLKKIQLLEISPVTFPANGLARVSSVKSIDDLESLADAERLLRDRGMSKADALALVSKIKNFSRSDSGDQGSRSESELAELRAALQRRNVFATR